jgi:queuine tRNA-ribosyltransferase
VAVATNAALKGVSVDAAREEGQDLVFCNSYHLLLQPGPDVVREAGGVHRFMGMSEERGTMGPVITDSGGFQVFSLMHGTVFEDLREESEVSESGSFSDSKGGGKAPAEMKRAAQSNSKYRPAASKSSKPAVRVTEEGVVFRSYRDGAMVPLTPESTVDAQKAYGADIIVPLDELPSYGVRGDGLRRSVERTHRWEARSLGRHLERVESDHGDGQAM